jgi:hypothetical protein
MFGIPAAITEAVTSGTALVGEAIDFVESVEVLHRAGKEISEDVKTAYDKAVDIIEDDLKSSPPRPSRDKRRGKIPSRRAALQPRPGLGKDLDPATKARNIRNSKPKHDSAPEPHHSVDNPGAVPVDVPGSVVSKQSDYDPIPNPCGEDNINIVVRYLNNTVVADPTVAGTMSATNFRIMSPTLPTNTTTPPSLKYHFKYFHQLLTMRCKVDVFFQLPPAQTKPRIFALQLYSSPPGTITPPTSGMATDHFLVQRFTKYKIVYTNEGRSVKLSYEIDPAMFFGVTQQHFVAEKDFHSGDGVTRLAQSELWLRAAVGFASGNVAEALAPNTSITADLTYYCHLTDPYYDTDTS